MPKRLRFALLPLVLPLASPLFAESPAPTPPSPSPQSAPAASDLQNQLASVQDQLATALHSFSVLHDENTQLKEDADKNAAQLDSAQRTIAELRLQSAAATRVGALETQLRQSQDQIAALAAENAKLRLRLAVLGPPPAGGMSVPSRPAQH